MTDPQRPVLIYRLGSLGDSVVALPCFHAIARAFPGTRIAVTNVPVSSKAAALEVILSPGGFIDGAIDYPVGTRSARRLWNLRKAIRATGARTLVYLAAPRGRAALLRDLVFFRLCGLTTIVGAPRGADQLHCRETADGLEQECKRLVRTLAALEPIDLDDRANWDLRFTEAERARAAEALAPLRGSAFLGINMGGKDASKDWGDANWAALIESLARKHRGMGLIAVGAREDFDRSGAVLARWQDLGAGPVANLCGLLSPRESGAALGGASLFIGHDSGPLHLAAAGGAPVLGLFGNFNRPRQWHPYGARARVIHEMRGTGAITVDRVAQTVADMLPGHRDA